MSAAVAWRDEHCRCGGYHHACRMRDLEPDDTAPAALPAVPKFDDIKRKRRAIQRNISDSSTASSESELTRLPATPGELSIPLTPSATPAMVGAPLMLPSRASAPATGLSVSVLGSSTCKCGGYHRACHLQDMEQQSTQASTPGVPETTSPFAGIPSAKITGGCTCGGYFTSCPVCAIRAEVRVERREERVVVREEQPSGGRSATVFGSSKCACGGYHRACRLRDMEQQEGVKLSLQEPPVLPAPFQGAPSAVITGGCNCGGYYRACPLCAERPEARDERPAPQSLEQQLAACIAGIQSSAVLGANRCACGGYHRSCRLCDLLSASEAPAFAAPAEGVSSAPVAGGGRCKAC